MPCRPSQLVKSVFKDRIIIVSTNEKTFQIKILGVAQFIILAIITALMIFCISKYNRYKNYHNYAQILEENDNLKDEHKKLRKKFAEYDEKANKLNEYLETVVKNSNDIKAEKPIKKNYKNATSDEMIGKLKDHELYAYATIEARKKDVDKFVKKIGIANISYNKLIKTAKVAQDETNIGESMMANVLDTSAVGGIDETVDLIKIVKNTPFLRVSKEKITDKNFDREINKMIKMEKTLNSLPFGMPTDGKYRITSTYGFREDPIEKDGKLRVHRGIDIVIDNNRVLATKAGVVVFVGTKGGYGKCVDIEHKKDGVSGSIITHYAHLDSFFVVKGQHVEEGTLIGIQGNTGKSTGPHLHYEILINSQSVNPMKFINAKSYI